MTQHGHAIRSRTALALPCSLESNAKPCAQCAPGHDCAHETEKPSDYAGVFGELAKGLNV